ncbi:hypothetical protein HMPREF3155_03950 [Corynebacterium sp. HMSC06D04]|uniref:ABC transporter ATP-binding protein n=1 Tax=Corynebacterium TaxID=1716 RepID=UPI0008A5D483|nr:ABC transporter ATP-binding protein [Corynebacterium sp. HMSC06D04]OFT52173.1 hypothetical protein HMPREF3155_03950 [Corynebacterium sp. HMSC06D04]
MSLTINTAKSSGNDWNWRLTKRVLQFVSFDTWPIMAIGAVLVISSGASTLTPIILGKFVDSLLEPDVSVARISLIALAATMTLFSALLTAWSQYLSVWLGQRQVFRLRKQLAEATAKAPYVELGKINVGDISSNFTSDVASAQSLTSNALRTLTSTVSAVIFGGFAITSITPWAAAIAICAFPIMIVTSEVVGRKISPVANWALHSNGKILQISREIADQPTALLLRTGLNKNAVDNRVQSSIETGKRATLSAARVQCSYGLLVGLMAGALTITTYFVGGVQVTSGKMTVGDLAALIALMPIIYGSLQDIAGIRADFASSMAAFSRIYKTLDRLETNHIFTDQGLQHVIKPGVIPTLRVENLVVGYEQKKCLGPVSFRGQVGSLTVLEGASGIGKSTLLHTLVGEIPPLSGRVFLEGKELSPSRPQIGLVSQDALFLSGSLAENFRLAVPNATDSEIWTVLEKVGLKNEIESLPNQLNTDVGHQGTRFSGGQKMRLSIARALLTRPFVLALDEPIAHLDEESREKVFAAISEFQENGIVLAVSHQREMSRAATQKILFQPREQVENINSKDLNVAP